MRRLSKKDKVGLLIEVAICFGPIALLLCAGYLVILPSMFVLWRDPLGWESGLVPLLWIFGGTCGLVSLVNVVGALRSDSGEVRRPELVLTGIVAGSAAIVHYMELGEGFHPLKLIGLMPLLASAHIIYLARESLFRPGTAVRTMSWVAAICIVLGTLYASVASFTTQSHSELVDRKAVWTKRRPVEYEYSLWVSGEQDPGLTTPRLVRVREDRVIAAGYTYVPSPGTQLAAEPAELRAWTIDRLFDELTRAQGEGAQVKALFNDRFGYPTRMQVEYAKTTRSTWFAEMKTFEAFEQASRD